VVIADIGPVGNTVDDEVATLPEDDMVEYVKQLVWFSNYQKRVEEGGLNDILDDLASKHGLESFPFLGATGIMETLFLIDVSSGCHK
jgi:hypothetical protein